MDGKRVKLFWTGQSDNGRKGWRYVRANVGAKIIFTEFGKHYPILKCAETQKSEKEEICSVSQALFGALMPSDIQIEELDGLFATPVIFCSVL